MIIKRDIATFASYLEDTSNLSGRAHTVYIPQDCAEMAELLRECGRKRMPITCTGGRTGTTGGCVAQGGIIISSEALNKKIYIDAQKNCAIVDAGVTLEQLATHASRHGLMLAASPTESLATVGGAVNTCASGVRGFGYGSIRKHVIGIRVLLSDGDTLIIERGRFFASGRRFDVTIGCRRLSFPVPGYTMPLCKHQAGYYAADGMDIIDLFIGSEGTLGVITECSLQLQPIPAHIFDGLVFFASQTRAFDFCQILKEYTRNRIVHPVSLEFFDNHTLDMLRPQHACIPAAAQAAVYFEQEAGVDTYESLFMGWARLAEETSDFPEQTIFADTPAQRKKIFEFRHQVPQMINEFLRQHGRQKAATDIAVPHKYFVLMFRAYQQIAQAYGLRYAVFGHIGESHLHFNFLPVNEHESLCAQKGLFELCQRAVVLGGTVSAEHGIGKIKRKYLQLLYTPEYMREMAAVKKYFDGSGILNQDNIFDKELLS